MAKRIIAVLLCMCLVFAMSACASDQSGSTADSSSAASDDQALETPDEEQSESVAGDDTAESDEGGASWENENITLTILHQHSPESKNADVIGFWELLTKWEEEHPNVTLEKNYAPQDELKTKLQAASAAGELPDIMDTIGYYIKNFADNGLVLDLTDAIDAYEYSEKITEGLLTPYTYKDRVYALPRMVAMTSIVFYNKAIWAQAGYETFPDNWEDIYAANDYFKEQGITPWAVGNLDQYTTESFYMGVIMDRFCGTDYTWNLLNLDPDTKWTDPKFIEALAFFQMMGTDGWFNEDWSAIYADDGWSLYCQGRAATVVQGGWNITGWEGFEIMTDDVYNNTGIALFPAVEGGLGAANTVAGGAGWAFGVSGTMDEMKTEAALDCLFAINGYEYSQYMVENSGHPWVFDVGMPSDLSKFAPPVVEFMEVSSNWAYVPIMDVNFDAKIIDVCYIDFADLWAGKTTPEKVAANLQQAQEALIADQ